MRGTRARERGRSSDRDYNTSMTPPSSAEANTEANMAVVRPSASPPKMEAAPAACGPNVAPKV